MDAAAVAYAKTTNEPVARSGSFYGGAGAQATAENVDIADLRQKLVRALEMNLEQPRNLG